MSALVFMSREHVDRMNDLLAGSADVLAACADLDREYEIVYELRNGPDGTVYWVLRFDRASGARFSLNRTQNADLTYVGDWAEVIRSSRAARNGERVEPSLEVRGDPSVTDRVGTAYAAAQRVATIPVEFPGV